MYVKVKGKPGATAFPGKEGRLAEQRAGPSGGPFQPSQALSIRLVFSGPTRSAAEAAPALASAVLKPEHEKEV